ncbi:AhpC/TSA antioxidant enzyme [Penicillium ucsense]|uniref:AhpC/TSA antioxidant enzyme n=1 Tax=Penicillium ucsense TaxID=2839758 RepID=A0A8J8WBZ1_9EURO|nr:AhpC/TSA antioxidant enzyme [Penicillium ucsense]KAF7737272.1 AhpC/TSA antioxidant enzyme [Penicillium ucsense]
MSYEVDASTGPNPTVTVTDPPVNNPSSTTESAPPAADDVNAAPPDAHRKRDEEPPSTKTLEKVADYSVLDKNGDKHTFKSLYEGPGSTRRVLVIFIRHFFCGSCQAYVQTLSESFTPEQLLHLPTPTSIVIIGCGDPSLIDFYAKETNCPFSIYADPKTKLYDELGMTSTYALGAQPKYIRKGLARMVTQSIMQELRNIGSALTMKGGDTKRVGGEFLFESNEGQTGEKRVSWCHRMTTTRDHAEVEILSRILHVDGTELVKEEQNVSS